MRKSLFLVLLVLTTFGCQGPKTTDVPEVKSPAEKPTIPVLPAEKPTKIEVSKLANKSAGEVDKIFGAPAETKNIENGGKYRLYKLPDFPKGLAIRFYGDQAKSFNLILEKPAADSKQAILQNLGIDVGRGSPVKDPKEPLTESFKGSFGGVNFTKIAAKKQENGNGFIFVFAEAAR